MTIKGKGEMETWFLLGDNTRSLPGQDEHEMTSTAGNTGTATNGKVTNNATIKPPGEKSSYIKDHTVILLYFLVI